jgi:hypothetical protein
VSINISFSSSNFQGKGSLSPIFNELPRVFSNLPFLFVKKDQPEVALILLPDFVLTSNSFV